MDIWKYTPGFVARPVIRGLKKVRGTNENRKRFLNLRKENDFLVVELNESDQAVTMITSENEALRSENAMLESRLETNKGKIVDYAVAKGNLKRAYQQHVAAMLTGHGSRVDSEMRDFLDIPEGLESLAKSVTHENESLTDENETLKEDNFKYRIAAAVGEADVGRFSAFAYVGGHVYGTNKFKKYCGDGFDVALNLGRDVELINALDRGDRIERKYNDMTFVFLSNKKEGDFNVAYVIPDQRDSRAELFVKAGIRAAKKLRRELRKDYDFEGVSFA